MELIAVADRTPRPFAPASAPIQDWETTLGVPALTTSYTRDEEIFAEEERAEFVYRVVSGAVRITRLLSDGRRHISAFLLPGEYFGLENGPVHRFSAEAIADSRIALIRRSTLEAQAARDTALARALWKLTATELERLQDHLLLLGRKCAVQRVAAFLLEMSARAPGERYVNLAMSRSDIADYLGLTIETVSRTLSQLEREGLIKLEATRTIDLRRRDALRALDV